MKGGLPPEALAKGVKNNMARAKKRQGRTKNIKGRQGRKQDQALENEYLVEDEM